MVTHHLIASCSPLLLIISGPKRFFVNLHITSITFIDDQLTVLLQVILITTVTTHSRGIIWRQYNSRAVLPVINQPLTNHTYLLSLVFYFIPRLSLDNKSTGRKLTFISRSIKYNHRESLVEILCEPLSNSGTSGWARWGLSQKVVQRMRLSITDSDEIGSQATW